MDVRGAAEVPDEVRAFEPPDVPLLVLADVVRLVEGHVELVEPAAGLEDGDGLLDVLPRGRGRG